MRIITFGIFSDKLSGQDTFLLNMNEHMRSVKMDFVVVGSDCIHKDIISSQGSELYYVSDYWKDPVKYISDCRKVLKQNRKTHPIAYFNLFSMVHIIPVIIAKMLKYKVVLHSHNSDIPDKKALHRLNRFLFSSKKGFTRFACSEKAALFMFGKKRVKDTIIIKNAIDTGHFMFSEEARSQLRAELEIGNRNVYGFVGRLDSQKNPLFLIEIFKRISERDKDPVFLIVGEGKLKDEVIELIGKYSLSDRVILLGNRRDVNRIYSCMDLFLLPSKSEGFGIVLVEAQASGLTCIISEGVIPEEIRLTEGGVRFVSLESSADVWADEAVRCIGESLSRKDRNDEVRRSDYNIEKEAGRLENLFLQLR